jgi:hypothetical protein
MTMTFTPSAITRPLPPDEPQPWEPGEIDPQPDSEPPHAPPDPRPGEERGHPPDDDEPPAAQTDPLPGDPGEPYPLPDPGVPYPVPDPGEPYPVPDPTRGATGRCRRAARSSA